VKPLFASIAAKMPSWAVMGYRKFLVIEYSSAAESRIPKIIPVTSGNADGVFQFLFTQARSMPAARGMM